MEWPCSGHARASEKMCSSRPSSACPLAERLSVRPEHLYEHAAARQLAGQLHGLGDTACGGLLQRDAVDHHVDEVLDLLVQGNGLTG
ncbi:MAG: hypothetical protein ACLSGS_10390 [Adlercreutzia sp.]